MNKFVCDKSLSFIYLELCTIFARYCLYQREDSVFERCLIQLVENSVLRQLLAFQIYEQASFTVFSVIARIIPAAPRFRAVLTYPRRFRLDDQNHVIKSVLVASDLENRMRSEMEGLSSIRTQL